MNLLFAGDLHITEERPRNRTDENYFLTQAEKIKQILSIGNKHKAPLFLPGDIFNHYKKPSNYLLQFYIQLFSNYPYKIYGVRGQHDLKLHSTDVEDTALAVLEAAKVIQIVNPLEDYVCIYRASFGEEIPPVKDKAAFNILITHRMIVHNDKIWEQQENFDYAENLLRKHPEYDIIVSGDNHHYFHAEVQGRHLFNCGSLMRATTAQLEHVPKIVIFDLATKKFQEIPLSVKPIAEVFNLEKVEKEKKERKNFDAFIKGLSETTTVAHSLKAKLEAALKANKVDKEIRNIFDEVMEGIEE